MIPDLRTKAEWPPLRKAIEERIAELQVKLEDDLCPEVTGKVRGRIAELRHFIEQVEPSTFIPPSVPVNVPGSGY